MGSLAYFDSHVLVIRVLRFWFILCQHYYTAGWVGWKCWAVNQNAG